ncbi:Canalicular multispecific organic anion transporter 2 [Dissophora ornata]|nr:Canalicular multispecific organic anion transporter 2 [Dissophora ornata]
MPKISHRIIYGLSGVFMTTACVSLLTRIVQLSQDQSSSSATMFGTVTLFVAWILGLGLNHLEHINEIRSSGYIFSYYVFCILASMINIRTMHDTNLSDQSQFISFCIFFGAMILGFVVEAWPRRKPVSGNTPQQPKLGSTLQGEKEKVDESEQRGRARGQEEEETELTAYNQANLFSRICFHFMQDLFSKGFHRPLQDEDIVNLMPKRIQTRHSYPSLARSWHRHVESQRSQGKTPNLIGVVLFSLGWAWLPVTLVSFAQSILEYSQVLLLSVLLDYISSSSQSGAEATTTTTVSQGHPIAYGIIISFGMFFATFLATLASGQFFQLATTLGIELKSGLIGLIYEKSLVLSPGARQRSTVGEISNHMSVDCERIERVAMGITMLLTSVFEVCVGIWLLYVQLGPSSLTSVGVVILVMPVQALAGNLLNKAKSKKMETMDSRIRALNELLSAMKTIKMYNWEESFRQKISRFRTAEIGHLRYMGVAWAFMCIMFTSLPLVMSLLTFVVYSLVGGPGGSRGVLTPQTVFVSMTLFSRLAQPLGRISGISSTLISASVCFKRIQGYMLEEELDAQQIEFVEPGAAVLTEVDGYQTAAMPAISIQDGVFAWSTVLDEKKRRQAALEAEEQKLKKTGRDNENDVQPTEKSTNPTRVLEKQTFQADGDDKEPLPTLTNINLEVPHGSLTVIVGRVGQGKSSLMSAMVGEMYKRQGRVVISGSVAFVPQQAWIINASLRDNILFGKPLEKERYDHILECSGLLPDIAILPAGDLTEIGERGINLSGGQKQRVSLARAAYHDADIYLMDDPLSAVDAHVDQHLWDAMIGPEGLLKNKTRVLITHGIHHLSAADQIVVMKGGEVSELGQYQGLLDAGKAFYQLITDYAVQEQKNRSKETVAKDEKELMDADQATVEDSTANTDAMEIILKDNEAQLVLAEEAAVGNVGWGLFHRYVKSATYLYSFLSLFLYMLSQASQIGINVWMQHWASKQETYQQDSVGTFLGVFAALVIAYMSLDVSVNLIIFVGAGVRSSRLLHDNLLNRVLRLPMSFFDTTPVGRIVNRFSTDIDNLDEQLPTDITNIYYFLTTVVGTIIVISFTLPIFLALVPFLLFFYFLIQTYFMRTSRSLKRIHMISKSPLYQHFDETLAGVSTIRVMKCSPRFLAENASKSDKSANAYFAFTTADRWLNIRLEFLGAIIVLAASLLCVWKRDELGAGGAGLALSYALTVTFTITYLVKSLGSLQNQLVSVERIEEYCDKNPEAPSTIEEMVATGNKTSARSIIEHGWPLDGRVSFKNYSARYREGMDLVIRNISFEVLPGERVGIVGRTGAGKSSLTLALFRIIEAANSHWAKVSYNSADKHAASTLVDALAAQELQNVEVEEDGGSIEIDGVDISTIGLYDLRHHLSIIPQDATLFAGTVRENLDPFGKLEDAELWTALERAHLKDHICTLAGGLSYEVASSGENFSAGQRSLLCLARALLCKTKILVLDEATAAVDVETDELIQRTIREEFKDRTILTIAHRIKTIMDSDKILVLEKGRVQEYGTPEELLKRSDSLFYQLAERAGELPERRRVGPVTTP